MKSWAAEKIDGCQIRLKYINNTLYRPLKTDSHLEKITAELNQPCPICFLYRPQKC